MQSQKHVFHCNTFADQLFVDAAQPSIVRLDIELSENTNQREGLILNL